MKRVEFAARVWSKLIAFAAREGLLPSGGGVLAAVSGGADSVVLAHFLAQMARRKGFRLELFHLNHGLRGNAARADGVSVERLAEKLGCAFTLRKADVRTVARARRTGLEDAGRHERYRLLLERARRGGFAVVATGHHLDDQAETVLLHLLRGTSLAGLGGIAPCRPLGPGVDLIRPLLALTRAEILLYLKEHDLSWREDASNSDPKFTRNWVRRTLIPLLERRAPGVRGRLAEISAAARQAAASRSAKTLAERSRRSGSGSKTSSIKD
jgi:tRNA(Ile)-lysidine synthase